MLKNFIYLNDDVLGSYLSSVEGGARSTSSHEESSGRSKGGRASAKVVGVEGTANRSERDVVEQTDTPAARYDRLASVAEGDAERLGWWRVLDPTELVGDVPVGTMIDVDCEVFVPDTVKMLSTVGGISGALALFEGLLPSADALGLNTKGMTTDPAQFSAMRQMTASVGNDLVVVGELDGVDIRLVGRLRERWIRGEIDGLARLVGKVSRRLPLGHSVDVLALLGAIPTSRAQRRGAVRGGHEDDERAIRGPALILDILAIYQ